MCSFTWRVLDGMVGQSIQPQFITMQAICNILYTILNGRRNDYADADFTRHMTDMIKSAASIRKSGAVVAFSLPQVSTAWRSLT